MSLDRLTIMSERLQAVRGMNDLLPADTVYWQYVESICREVVQSYGYQEVRFPIVESTALFKRCIGQDTDIVSKEMYTFAGRKSESLTLRPEGTAGCVRMGLERHLLHNQIQRLWYAGPMFRHERPQKGRYRQFHQFGVEAFGMSSPALDAELIVLSARLLERLGLRQDVTLQLNSLGTLAARRDYTQALQAFLQPHIDQLDPDSQRRLDSNPMRILDSKHPETQALVADAPRLADYLSDASHAEFQQLRDHLDQLGVAYTIQPNLVRGLDYYSGTVFEWVTSALGAQGTVCAGGRFDGLVSQLGGKPSPAMGFAMGLERIILLVQQQQACQAPCHIYVSAADSQQSTALLWAETLRSHYPQLTTVVDLTAASLKAQRKRADKQAAQCVVVLMDDERAQLQLPQVSDLDQTVTLPELITFITERQQQGALV